jgi:hypothetical protein
MKSAIVPIEITHLDVKPVANKPLETICLGHGVEVDRTLMRHFGKLAQVKSKDLKADEPHSYPIATITSLRPSWKPAELLTMRIFPALIRKENKIVIGGVHDSALPGFKNFLLRPRQEPEIKMFRVAA